MIYSEAILSWDVEIFDRTVAKQLEVIFVDVVEPPDQGGPNLPEGIHSGVQGGVALPPAPSCEVDIDSEAELLPQILVVPGKGLHLHYCRVSKIVERDSQTQMLSDHEAWD